MDGHHEPSRDSLALARKHVRALTDGGLSRQALLRALLEQEEAGNDLPPPQFQTIPSQPQSQPQPQPQPQLKKSASLSRTLSLSQAKSKSHWSVSTNAPRPLEEGDRPPSSDQLSTSTHSGSRGSFLSSHTVSTSLSSRSSTITQFPGPELSGSRPASASTRAYWCTSCDTEFKRKFDWKRHEDEFHERYKKYPCPDCNRVFWGANTFNQHHKTRHSCKTCPHADKVIQYTRKKRAWACGFCAAFLPSMDRYIDHIGLHYESGRTKAHWYHSNVIYGLLHQPGVNAAWKNIIGARFSHIPKDQQPRYGWEQKTTGRKQGFLENETAGNLQDLLEFFNPTKDDAVKVARLAFDMADLLPANQAPGRSSLDVPDKSPNNSAAPPPKRGKSSSTSSRRKPSGNSSTKIELVLPPTVKERPITQWPSGFAQNESIPEMPRVAKTMSGGSTGAAAVEAGQDTQMPDFDATAVPQPLFANSTLSPTHPPPPSYSQHQSAPSISISPSSDQPTYLTPTTPLQPPTPTTPFPGSGMPRDTVVDLLQDYMSRDPMPDVVHGPAGDMHPQPHAHMGAQPLCQHPPFGQYEDWNSICSTMVEDLASPRHNGPPLPPAPHEHHHHQRNRSQGSSTVVVRRSDFWAPADGGRGSRGEPPESMYIDDVQACDLTGLPPPHGMSQDHGHAGRRSDVWASSAVDYEGLGYENEVAAPPPPSSNWL